MKRQTEHSIQLIPRFTDHFIHCLTNKLVCVSFGLWIKSNFEIIYFFFSVRGEKKRRDVMWTCNKCAILFWNWKDIRSMCNYTFDERVTLLCNGLMYQNIELRESNDLAMSLKFFIFFENVFMFISRLIITISVCYSCSCSSIFSKCMRTNFIFSWKIETVLAMFSSDSFLNCVEFCVEIFLSFNTSNSLVIFSVTHVWFDSISLYVCVLRHHKCLKFSRRFVGCFGNINCYNPLKIWFFCYIIAPETKTAAHILYSPYYIESISKWW